MSLSLGAQYNNGLKKESKEFVNMSNNDYIKTLTYFENKNLLSLMGVKLNVTRDVDDKPEVVSNLKDYEDV